MHRPQGFVNQLARRLDAEIEERSLLKHAFYKMWSDGELTREHLAGYSQEYFQLVKAVPALVGNISRFVREPAGKKAVSQIEAEENEHVRLWESFARSMGVSKKALDSYRGTPKTRRAISMVTATTRASLCEGAAAMYSIEYEQPRISKTKLEGLRAFYGMSGLEEGTEYFREHQVADVRHAAVWRSMLQRRAAGREDREAAACRAARVSLRAQNAVLDSVMETYVSPTIA
jgi:pyrroloquinoline-quinone synthase